VIGPRRTQGRSRTAGGRPHQGVPPRRRPRSLAGRRTTGHAPAL